MRVTIDGWKCESATSPWSNGNALGSHVGVMAELQTHATPNCHRCGLRSLGLPCCGGMVTDRSHQANPFLWLVALKPSIFRSLGAVLRPWLPSSGFLIIQNDATRRNPNHLQSRSLTTVSYTHLRA